MFFNKKNKNKKTILIFFILGLIFWPNFLYSIKGSVLNKYGYDINAEIEKLNKEIEEQKKKQKELQDKQTLYEKAIEQNRAEKASLNNEIAILDNRLAKTQLDIEKTNVEIERTKLEIRKTETEIEETNKRIEKEKNNIATAIKLIFKQDMSGTLEILMLNNSLSDFLNHIKYLEDINKEIGESLNIVKNYQEKLEKNKINLSKKNNELESLKEELEQKEGQLDSEKDNKFYLLEQTSMSEARFQRLLAQAKQEQLRAANDIATKEKQMRQKLAQMSDNKLLLTDSGFIWPVPKNVITAYFHDPDYPFRYVFEHPAIDIRAAQGTQIRVANSGYVARAKNAGMGYSYIMIVHGDGLSTVYGHVSKIYVSEDDYVSQGQVIGLSGGLPGTSGAGPMTTGPHLHFEVRLNGIPVNPLDYLP